jgi:hypothetical protein
VASAALIAAVLSGVQFKNIIASAGADNIVWSHVDTIAAVAHLDSAVGGSVRGNVFDLHRETTSQPQLAINGEIEHCQLAGSSFDLKLRPRIPARPCDGAPEKDRASSPLRCTPAISVIGSPASIAKMLGGEKATVMSPPIIW